MDIDQKVLDHKIDHFDGVIIGENLPDNAEEFAKVLSFSMNKWKEV